MYDIAIVGTVGVPAAYGGFETLAEQLVRHLGSRQKIVVYCTTHNKTEHPEKFLEADLRYIALNANGWQSLPYDFISIWRASTISRTILILGVSGCLLLPLLRAVRPSVRIVTNIDGLEWNRQKWGYLAKAILRISEKFAVKYSDAVISDNQGIYDYIRQEYRRDAALIAYGGDDGIADLDTNGKTDTEFEENTYYITVCRIEPENNIEEILRAFDVATDINIVMVGNWKISNYSKRLYGIYKNKSNIQLLQTIYDKSRLRALRVNARAYIHGHSAGGTNPSLVEAMSAGLAVFAYDVDYNRYTTNNKAFYWKKSAELHNALTHATEQTLEENRRAMKSYAESHYTWDKVTAQYTDILAPHDK